MEPIRLLRDARAFHAALRTVLPVDAADGIVSGIKHLHNPRQAAHRAQAAGRIDVDAAEVENLRRDGFLRFSGDRFRGLDAALAAADATFQALAAAGDLDRLRARAAKDFLVRPVEDCGFIAQPAIFRFAVSRPLIDLATAYLGRVPLLSAIQLWWSPINDSLAKSQMFHRDAIDRNQLKFMFNIREVGPDNGPFTLIPAAESARLMRQLDYSTGKLKDETIAAAGGLDHAIALTGPRGAGACCDTSRCLHFGSRGNRSDRLILMVQFVDHLAPRYHLPPWHAHLDEGNFELDEVQRLALAVR